MHTPTPRKKLIAVSLALATLALGCEAAFTDLRPDEDGAPLTFDPLLGQDEEDQGDATSGDDSALDPVLEEVVLQGSFERVDYDAAGGAQIVRLTDGTYEVRLDEDFFNAPIPGPVLVLTLEPSIGTTIDPRRGDIEIA
ncbi:MAG: hypothetical protein AAGI01_03395, partial [Myxococcota bacterium]